MKNNCVIVLFTLLFVLGTASGSFAGVEYRLQQTLKMDRQPLDVAISPDRKHIFVLTNGGNIFVYARNGEIEGKIQMGNHADQIRIGPRGEQLFITSRKDKAVQVIRLDFIFEIDVSKSPYKGPRDAPVVIAVFDEFQ